VHTALGLDTKESLPSGEGFPKRLLGLLESSFLTLVIHRLQSSSLESKNNQHCAPANARGTLTQTGRATALAIIAHPV